MSRRASHDRGSAALAGAALACGLTLLAVLPWLRDDEVRSTSASARSLVESRRAGLFPRAAEARPELARPRVVAGANGFGAGALPAVGGARILVVDDADRPVAGERLRFHSAAGAGREDSSAAVTDASGWASFPSLPPGPGLVTSLTGPGLELEPRPGVVVEDVLRLRAFVAVEFQVTDGDGQPFPGALVWFSERNNVVEGRFLGPTRADGTLCTRLAGFARYAYAVADGQRASPFVRVHVESAVDGRLRVPLCLNESGSEVEGRVVDAAGRALGGLSVLVGEDHPERVDGDGRRRSRPGGLRATTDEHGSFLVRGLPPGRQRLRIRGASWEPYEDWIVVRPDVRTVTEVTLRPGAHVVGRVVDERGEPVAGDGVAVGRRYGAFDFTAARSDATGAFRLTGLRAGAEVTVGAWHRSSGGRGSATARARPDAETSILIELTRGRVVRGTVLDAATAEPLDAWLGVASTETGWRDFVRVRDGSFEVAGVPDGGVDVRLYPLAAHGGLPTWWTRVVALRDRVELQAETRVATLRGQVVTRAGDPARGCELVLGHEELSTGVRVHGDAQGAFSVSELPPGSYELRTAAADDPWLRSS